MLNFEDLLNGIDKIESKEQYDSFLCDFFSKQNYKNYTSKEELDKEETKALKVMFTSSKAMMERVDEALKCDPFCIEAFFVYTLYVEDTFLGLRFRAYYNEANNYGDLDIHEKHSFITIMHFYVNFLVDINNITSAIKVLRLIIKLTNKIEEYLDDLVYLYFKLEMVDEIYKLYCHNDFNARNYVLLIVTELKHDEDMKAREVVEDMFEKIKYSTYLDHLWDLDDNDPEQAKFYDEIDEIFEDIIAIPNFFSYINEVKEQVKGGI